MGYTASVKQTDTQVLIDLRCEAAVFDVLLDGSELKAMSTPHITMETDTYRALPVASDHWLIQTSDDNKETTIKALREALSPKPVNDDRNNQSSHHTAYALTDISDYYVGLCLSGSDCAAIMAQACSLDLHLLQAGYTTRCRFARTAAIIHVIEPWHTYNILVESTYANYLQDWLKVAIDGYEPLTNQS